MLKIERSALRANPRRGRQDPVDALGRARGGEGRDDRERAELEEFARKEAINRTCGLSP